MQANATVRQTYGRLLAIVSEMVNKLKTEPETDIKANLVLITKVDSNVSSKSFMDKVMCYLVKEETIPEQLIGYGVCALAILYLLGSMARAFI